MLYTEMEKTLMELSFIVTRHPKTCTTKKKNHCRPAYAKNMNRLFGLTPPLSIYCRCSTLRAIIKDFFFLFIYFFPFFFRSLKIAKFIKTLDHTPNIVFTGPTLMKSIRGITSLQSVMLGLKELKLTPRDWSRWSHSHGNYYKRRN